MDTGQSLLLLVLASLTIIPQTRGHHEIHFCGRPEIPEHGSVNQLKDRYEVSETVRFSCQKQYILQGAIIGVCLQNETWSIQSPTCDLNVAYEQPANRTWGHPNNPSRNAVDGNRDTCADIVSPPSGELNIFFPKVYSIKYILLDLEAGLHNLEIVVIDGNKQQYCGRVDGEVYNRTSRIDCNQGNAIQGHAVRIKDHRKSGTLKICEVIVITDSRSCGQPELPSHMIPRKPSSFTMRYECSEGYRIIGEPEKECIDGKWQPPPRCLHAEDLCGYPGTPSGGNVFPSSQAYAINDNVTYNCADGLTVVGSDKRTCQKDGTWSLQIPRCEVNLALQKTVTTPAGFRVPLIVDGNWESCDKIEQVTSGQKVTPAQFFIDLGKEVAVQSVKIAFRNTDANYSIDVAITKSKSNQKAPVQVCKKFAGFLKTKSLELTCDKNLGDRIIITDVRAKSLVLCEVEVSALASEAEPLYCGEPEVPLHAQVIEVDVMPQKVKYYCPKGYRLRGNAENTCERGVWGKSLPRCDQISKDLDYEDTEIATDSPPIDEPDKPSDGKPIRVTKEPHEAPMDNEKDSTVVVGVMGIALGVTAASVSILCAVITIIIVMKKCRKTPRCRIPSHSTEDSSSRTSSRRNANWEDASMHYYDTVKDTDLPAYCESSCSFPQDHVVSGGRRGQLPVPSPQYDILDVPYSGTCSSDPESWAREQRTHLHENVTTV